MIMCWIKRVFVYIPVSLGQCFRDLCSLSWAPQTVNSTLVLTRKIHELFYVASMSEWQPFELKVYNYINMDLILAWSYLLIHLIQWELETTLNGTRKPTSFCFALRLFDYFSLSLPKPGKKHWQPVFHRCVAESFYHDPSSPWIWYNHPPSISV